MEKATGLQEGEINYYARTFREFLNLSQAELDRGRLSPYHVDVFSQIGKLIHGRGLEIEDARRELKAALARTGRRPRTAESVTPIVPIGRPVQTNRPARVIAISSGKGGVGKTTVTANLAIAFTEMGRKVAIFDADLGMGNVHLMMGIKPRVSMRHAFQENFTLEDVIVEGPLGIKMISGGQGIREMANMTPEQRKAILDKLQGLEWEADILLLDTGSGISETVLNFCAFADEIVIVTTPDLAAASDGFSIIKVLLEMEPRSKIGVIANQVASMYQSKNVFNRLSSLVDKHLKYRLGDLGYIIEDPNIKSSNRLHKVFKIEHANSPAAHCLNTVAETILHAEVFRNERKESAFRGLIGALKRTFVRG